MPKMVHRATSSGVFNLKHHKLWLVSNMLITRDPSLAKTSDTCKREFWAMFADSALRENFALLSDPSVPRGIVSQRGVGDADGGEDHARLVLHFLRRAFWG